MTNVKKSLEKKDRKESDTMIDVVEETMRRERSVAKNQKRSQIMGRYQRQEERENG
jgi:hypothetical protein